MQDLYFEQYPSYSDDQYFFFPCSSYDTPTSPDYSSLDEFGMLQDFSSSVLPTGPNDLLDEPQLSPQEPLYQEVPQPQHQSQCSVPQVQLQPVPTNQLEMKLLSPVLCGGGGGASYLPIVPMLPAVQSTPSPHSGEKFTLINPYYNGSEPSFVEQMQSLPVDVSASLSDFHYNKIFKQYRDQLVLSSHPTMSENDLELIRTHGRIYLLKNVKMIAPKIGPWKFNCHTPKGSDGSERQFNIPGLGITCRVKEWLTDDGLWRMYHFKEGKVKRRK